MSIRGLSRACAGVVFTALATACVPEEGTKGLEDSATSSCAAERHAVERAVEAYFVLEGSQPPTEADLVPNYLRSESASMDLDAEGNVVAAPGSGCI